MFKVDPRERPTVNDVISRLQEIAVARNVNLKTNPKLMDGAPPPQFGKFRCSRSALNKLSFRNGSKIFPSK